MAKIQITYRSELGLSGIMPADFDATDKQAELLANFTEHFLLKFKEAQASGAIPDGATETEIGRCVLQIAAAEFEPLSPFNKKMLANLRRFI